MSTKPDNRPRLPTEAVIEFIVSTGMDDICAEMAASVTLGTNGNEPAWIDRTREACDHLHKLYPRFEPVSWVTWSFACGVVAERQRAMAAASKQGQLPAAENALDEFLRKRHRELARQRSVRSKPRRKKAST